MTGPRTLFRIPLQRMAALFDALDIACGWSLRLQLTAVGEHYNTASSADLYAPFAVQQTSLFGTRAFDPWRARERLDIGQSRNLTIMKSA
jgi:hypothetical protein